MKSHEGTSNKKNYYNWEKKILDKIDRSIDKTKKVLCRNKFCHVLKQFISFNYIPNNIKIIGLILCYILTFVYIDSTISFLKYTPNKYYLSTIP